MMKDKGFNLLLGFDDRQMNEQTDICECRVAFTTENLIKLNNGDTSF